jgi:general secretion pathway protein F
MAEVAPGATAAGVAERLFRYRAVEIATGRQRVGEQRGGSAYDVRANLRRVGLEVEQLDEVAIASGGGLWAPLRLALQARRRRQRRMAKADLCDGLATLLQAGVPLEQALAALAATAARPEAERRLLEALRDRLRAGTPLAPPAAGPPARFESLELALHEATL